MDDEPGADDGQRADAGGGQQGPQLSSSEPVTRPGSGSPVIGSGLMWICPFVHHAKNVSGSLHDAIQNQL